MNKRNLFLDFDGTIADSVKRICEMYNTDYAYHPKFKPAKDYLVNKWDFSDQCPLMNKKKVEDYFSEERFFDNLQFIENAEEIINKLNNHFDIYVISMGSTDNLINKNMWLRKHLPCMKHFIPCNSAEVNDKSHINLKDCILIDDSSNNLKTCNADIKILYGDLFEWNEDWNGKRCWNWYEVYDYLMS